MMSMRFFRTSRHMLDKFLFIEAAAFSSVYTLNGAFVAPSSGGLLVLLTHRLVPVGHPTDPNRCPLFFGEGVRG